jgi:hypothetical protein
MDVVEKICSNGHATILSAIYSQLSACKWSAAWSDVCVNTMACTNQGRGKRVDQLQYWTLEL